MPHMIPYPRARLLPASRILVIVFWDAFEAIILPRRVTRKVRVTRLFYRITWTIWKFIAGKFPARKMREALLGGYGPMFPVAAHRYLGFGLVLGFGLMQYGAGSAVNVHEAAPGFGTDFYLSGTTFFTLGFGDVVPRSAFSRTLLIAEAGLGFGFLAVIVGYLPFIYGSFSKREVNISLLDARAGTPPTAGELLRRHSYPHGADALARSAERMGTLVRRTHGKPSLLSGSGLLPLAARQPIVDRFAHRHPGHLRAGKNRH